MKVLHVVVSTLILLGLTALLSFFFMKVNPALLILSPLALVFYCVLGWSLTKENLAGNIEGLPWRNRLALLIFFGPAYYCVNSWRQLSQEVKGE